MATPGTEASPLESQPAPGRSTGFLAERVPVVEHGDLIVHVIEAPEANPTPLESGTLVLTKGNGRVRLKVVCGRASLGNQSGLEGWSIESIESPLHARLYSHTRPFTDRRIDCYAYPGYFISYSSLPDSSESLELFIREANRTEPLAIRGPIPLVPDAMRRIAILPKPNSYLAKREVSPELLLGRTSRSALSALLLTDGEVGRTLDLHLTQSATVRFVEPPGTEYLPAARVVVRGAQDELVAAEQWKNLSNVACGTLAAGRYSAALLAPEARTFEHTITDWVTFELAAEEATVVCLGPLIPASPGPPVTELHGTLEFDGWELVRPWINQNVVVTFDVKPVADSRSKQVAPRRKSISLRNMEILQDENSGNPIWRWSVGEMPPGEYRCSLDAVQFRLDFELMDGNRDALHLRIPAMARTVLEFGVSTEQRVQSSALSALLIPISGPPLNHSTPSPKFLTGDAGSVEMISMPGAYTLMVMWDKQPYSKEVHLEAGWNHVVVPVEDVPLAVVRFVGKKGQPLPLDKASWDGVEILAPTGVQVHYVVEGVVGREHKGLAALQVFLASRGEYRIRGLKWPGLEDLRINLADGVSETVTGDEG